MDSEISIPIKLKSSDGKVFEVNDKILSPSKFLKDMIDNNKGIEQEITINKVDAKNLEKIIEYLKHLETEKPKVIPKPLPSNDLKSILSEWDYNFINPLTIEEAIDLLNAANFLDIGDLIALASAKLAAEMMTGPIDEARERLGINPGMTEEEMEEYNKYPLD